MTSKFGYDDTRWKRTLDKLSIECSESMKHGFKELKLDLRELVGYPKKAWV